jgi:hypothetical protein
MTSLAARWLADLLARPELQRACSRPGCTSCGGSRGWQRIREEVTASVAAPDAPLDEAWIAAEVRAALRGMALAPEPAPTVVAAAVALLRHTDADFLTAPDVAGTWLSRAHRAEQRHAEVYEEHWRDRDRLWRIREVARNPQRYMHC